MTEQRVKDATDTAGECPKCGGKIVPQEVWSGFPPEPDHTEWSCLDCNWHESEKPTNALRDVIAERKRQVSVEGWTPEHDDEHHGDLARAASVYALGTVDGHVRAEAIGWPYNWDLSWYKPTTPRRDLVKAAALILAEIERLDRQAPAAPSDNKPER